MRGRSEERQERGRGETDRLREPAGRWWVAAQPCRLWPLPLHLGLRGRQQMGRPEELGHSGLSADPSPTSCPSCFTHTHPAPAHWPRPLRPPPHAPSSGHLLRLHAAGPPRGSRPGGGERERGSTKSPIPRWDVPPPPPRPLRTPPRWGESAVRTSKSAPRPLVTSRAQAGYPG